MFSHVKIELICKQHLLLYTFHKIDIFFSYVLVLLNIVESPEGFILLLQNCLPIFLLILEN